MQSKSNYMKIYAIATCNVEESHPVTRSNLYPMPLVTPLPTIPRVTTEINFTCESYVDEFPDTAYKCAESFDTCTFEAWHFIIGKFIRKNNQLLRRDSGFQSVPPRSEN